MHLLHLLLHRRELRERARQLRVRLGGREGSQRPDRKRLKLSQFLNYYNCTISFNHSTWRAIPSSLRARAGTRRGPLSSCGGGAAGDPAAPSPRTSPRTCNVVRLASNCITLKLILRKKVNKGVSKLKWFQVHWPSHSFHFQVCSS